MYRRTYADYENTFQRKVETPVEVHLSLTKDVAVLCSKEWSHLDDSYDVDPPNKELTFWLSSFVRYKNQTVFSSVETMGQVLLELPTKEVIQVAAVDYNAGQFHGNPATDYSTCNATAEASRRFVLQAGLETGFPATRIALAPGLCLPNPALLCNACPLGIGTVAYPLRPLDSSFL